MAFLKKNGKTMSGFLKIRDFFKKSVLRKTAEFSVSDTGDPLILTCLVICYMTSSSNFSQSTHPTGRVLWEELLVSRFQS